MHKLWTALNTINQSWLFRFSQLPLSDGAGTLRDSEVGSRGTALAFNGV